MSSMDLFSSKPQVSKPVNWYAGKAQCLGWSVDHGSGNVGG